MMNKSTNIIEVQFGCKESNVFLIGLKCIPYVTVCLQVHGCDYFDANCFSKIKRDESLDIYCHQTSRLNVD